VSEGGEGEGGGGGEEGGKGVECFLLLQKGRREGGREGERVSGCFSHQEEAGRTEKKEGGREGGRKGRNVPPTSSFLLFLPLVIDRVVFARRARDGGREGGREEGREGRGGREGGREGRNVPPTSSFLLFLPLVIGRVVFSRRALEPLLFGGKRCCRPGAA